MRNGALIVLLSIGLAVHSGCGGLSAEAAGPTSREGDELQARDWHDRVVRLEGEASEAVAQGDACEDTCAIVARACELTERICDLSASDEYDEGTRVLCEDARPRCTGARGEVATRCECATGA